MRFLEIFEIFDKTLYFYRGFEKSPKISRKKQKQKIQKPLPNRQKSREKLKKSRKNLTKKRKKEKKRLKNTQKSQAVPVRADGK